MRLRHVTAPDIAHLLGRDVRTVRHQLRGETPWQVDDLVVIARRLDIPFDKILGK
jgi:predicted transcriptional regulator